ncbi:MAG TPA: hypothetical protein VHN16_00200 [Streptosporangiaceae bacterium]|nr:hypothetical protein [Streptosporangiaceae bacterium]
MSDPTPVDPDGSTGLASTRPADLLAAGLTESLGQLAMLAGTALSAPRASVMFAGTYLLPQHCFPTVSPRPVAVLTVSCTAMSGSAVWSPGSMT